MIGYRLVSGLRMYVYGIMAVLRPPYLTTTTALYKPAYMPTAMATWAPPSLTCVMAANLCGMMIIHGFQ